MPSQFVKVQIGTKYLLEVSPNAFPSGAGFFSFTSSQYFPPRIPLGWWVYDGTLADTSSQLFNEGVVVPGQGDITETTGSLIHTGSTEFTGSVNVSVDLSVIGSASVAELNWDGSVQDLSLFSSSVSSEFTDIEIDSGSFDNRVDILEVASAASGTLWTGSNGEISRESDVKITGSLDVSGNITAQEFHTEFVSSSIIFQSGSTKFGDSQDDQHSFTGSVEITSSLNVDGTASVSELEWDGSVQNLTLFSESVSSEFTDIETDSGSFDNRVDILEVASAASGTLWTGSNGNVSRESDVQITGSLTISGNITVEGTASVSELEWDGSVQNLTLFSESVSSEFTDIETDSGSFDTRIDILELGGNSASLNVVGFLFQAIHTGSTNVNTILPVSLSWDTQDLIDSPFTHSTVVSSSEIQVGVSGWYDTSYSILHETTTGNARTSIQSVIRLNGFFNIQKTQVVAYKRNSSTGASTSNVWSGLIQLSASDFIELVVSNAGGAITHEVITIPSSSLITLQLVRQVI